MSSRHIANTLCAPNMGIWYRTKISNYPKGRKSSEASSELALTTMGQAWQRVGYLQFLHLHSSIPVLSFWQSIPKISKMFPEIKIRVQFTDNFSDISYFRDIPSV